MGVMISDPRIQYIYGNDSYDSKMDNWRWNKINENTLTLFFRLSIMFNFLGIFGKVKKSLKSVNYKSS